MQSPVYNSLQDNDEKESERSSIDGSETHLLSSNRLLKTYFPPVTLLWILSIGFGGLSLVLASILVFGTSSQQCLGSFEKGYATDFLSAKSIVELEEVTFTGGPAYKDNGDKYIPNPAAIDYIGGPSPEVDAAWEELTYGRYIMITKEEAQATWPDHWEEYYHPLRRGYVAGIDMFHTLHCINQIRKALNSDYYTDVVYSERKFHMNHCLEQLRQYVMCAGDLTPIPTKFYPGVHRNYVMSDVPHTCRNFDKIREWILARFVNGSLEVMPDPE